jgi:RNA ligase
MTRFSDAWMSKLQKHVDGGIVNSIRHSKLPLTLYNYTRACQYASAWDAVTKQCRGLVLDDYGEIVARPMMKFFNDTEHKPEDVPWHLPCEVTEKMDGSLLIVFRYGNSWHVCTRGSFASEQAKLGADILWEQPLSELDSDCTYCFELIHPENRIVVDYGKRTEAVLLAAIEKATGDERPLDRFRGIFSVVRGLSPEANAKDLRAIIRDDEEGYVVRFANGFRIKVKGARYLELHRLLSGVTARMVWERLSRDESLDDVLVMVDEETRVWIEWEAITMRAAFDQIARIVAKVVSEAQQLPTRKQQALLILEKSRAYSGVAFGMLDRKKWQDAAWRLLYPEHRRPTRAALVSNE